MGTLAISLAPPSNPRGSEMEQDWDTFMNVVALFVVLMLMIGAILLSTWLGKWLRGGSEHDTG
jgi:hypothetical protein